MLGWVKFIAAILTLIVLLPFIAAGFISFMAWNGFKAGWVGGRMLDNWFKD